MGESNHRENIRNLYLETYNTINNDKNEHAVLTKEGNTYNVMLLTDLYCKGSFSFVVLNTNLLFIICKNIYVMLNKL